MDKGIKEGDGLAVQGSSGDIIGFAKLFRKRMYIEETELYLDGFVPLGEPNKPEDLELEVGTGVEAGAGLGAGEAKPMAEPESYEAFKLWFTAHALACSLSEHAFTAAQCRAGGA